MNTEEIKAMLAALDGALAPLLEAAVSIENVEVIIRLDASTFEATYDASEENWSVTVS